MTVKTKIGFGPKVKGKIVVLGQAGKAVTTGQIDFSLSGMIVLFLGSVSREVMEKAGLVGVVGVVVPSVHHRDYEYFRVLGEMSLLVLLKFGNLELNSELEKKLEKLDGEEGELDGDGKELTV